MPNLSIKNVPEHVVEKLRQRAVSHHRSLQGELLELICHFTEDDADETTNFEKQGDSSGWLSIAEIAAKLVTPQPRSSRNIPLAVDIIRQERDAR